MSHTRAPRMSAAARRAQLLDAATRLVGERGFHGVSIESIARSAGVTRASVYQHFPDLHAVLEAVIERETSRALAQVSQTALPEPSDGDRSAVMLESLRAYLLAVQNQPSTWRLILIPPEGAPKALHESIANGRETVLDALTLAVGSALTGSGVAPDAELTARVLSAISDEYARLLLTDPRRFPPERLLEHARWLLSLGVANAPR
ncbi:MAG: TetR/AcrR family transcriptional regulator [Solirubrobacterales bacterium]|nr:TetR/AcrR family transcriptional regulator [Solirubrobacterales bacterium]